MTKDPSTTFGLAFPKNLLGFLLGDLLTVTSFFAVGLCIAAMINIETVAQAIGGILFYALMFFGGIWLPRPMMPVVLRNISNGMPLGASVDSIQRAMQGLFPSPESMLVLTAYTLVFGYLAVRYFRWE